MRISAKVVLGFLLISLGSLAVTSVLSDANASRALTDQVLTKLDSLASVEESRLHAITDQNLERFALVASRTQLRMSLENYSRDPRPEYQARMNQILLDARASIASFRDLHALTLNGTVAASTNGTAIGTNRSTGEYFVRGQANASADIFFLGIDGAPGLYLSGPLFLYSTLIGVLVIESDVSDFFSLVEDYTGLGQTGETQLAERDVNGDARFLAPTRFDPYAALNRTIPSENANSAVIRALSGEEGLFVDAVDYRGKRVLAATRYAEGTGWGLVVKIDEEEAYAAVVQLRAALVLAVAAASVAVGLVSLLVARSITRPIVELTEIAKKISEGDLARRASVSSADEIGLLGRSFNRMAQSLVEANVGLEEKVKDRTAALEAEVGERMRAEQALAQKAEELTRSNVELERFASAASHDLQEPLRMIASYTQLLAKRYHGRLDADADEFIGYAVEGATRMQRLVNDLLAYARVGTRGKPFEPTDCSAVLARVTSDLRMTIEEVGAAVTSDPLPTVAADPSQLGLVFQNLVGNAIKFRGEAPPRVQVSAQRNGGEWLFSVRDNGIGIDPQYFDRLFQIFQRLHGRGEYPGTGIGLAICKKVVERHGGRIWIESAPGKGSTFLFTIPAKGDGAR